MELARAKQFAPRLYMDLPRPHFSSESASSSSSATTQPTIAAITPMALMRTNNLGLDYTNFLARPVLGFQSVNYPSGSTPPNGGKDNGEKPDEDNYEFKRRDNDDKVPITEEIGDQQKKKRLKTK